MKRTKTKILSVFLSFCMIISCMVGMSVTASAESKTLAVDTIYNIGDSIVVSADRTYIVYDDQNNATIYLNAGSYVVPQPGYYDYEYLQWTFDLSYITLYLGSGTTDGSETVTGIKCVSGDGTQANPYKFELVTGSSTPATTTGGFVKVTDKSQITEDNIGESTAAEAKAWIIANLTTLQSEQGTWYDFFFKENGTVKLVILNYTRLDEAHVNDENVYAPEDFSIASYYFSSNENVYFWGGSSTPSLPSWTNGNVIGILDGTKLTVAKKDGAQNGDMGTGWTAEGTTEWDSVKGTITELEIQDSVTSIGNGAFDNCLKLPSVTIPSSVTSIGNSAFSWCTALTSVTIPSSVTSIGNFAFYYCESLTSVTIPSSVTSIGNYAFSGCSKLASVTIPNSVTSIGFGSFQGCTSLTSVTIPDSVTSIDMNAFDKCSALTSVTIPSSVTRIGEEAFSRCTSLTSVKFNPGTADATLSIGEAAFYGTADGAKVAYGTGDTVLYDGENEITTDTLLTDIQGKNLTWKESTYTITMKNGGTASVDGNTVTKAPKGATVEIVAPVAEPGTEFNGWTSTSEGVTFEDASKATTKFTMPANDVTISASFQNIAYNITMINGGTAYVDGEPATTAEAGTVVTIKAKSSVSTPAKFNGWTTTTEGVEFADADSVETTFVMPISDVTITASFEGVTPYVPSYSTGTSTTTSSGTASSVDSASSKAKMWAVQNDDKSSITVGWEKVNGATKYSLYVKKNGKLEKVVDTKKTKVLIKNPANNVNLEYVLKYTIGGVESGENSAYTASIKVYYKPAVKASSKDGAVILKWNKVEGAEKYRVYKYTGGKLVKVADTTANAVRLKNVTTGKTYKYAVKAYVDGKWTKVTKSDIVSVKVK